MYTIKKLPLYVDYDNTIVNTARILPEAYYLLTGVKPVKDMALDWNADTCFPPKASREAIHKIFDIPLFFKLANDNIYPSALHILYDLSKYYDIHIISCGSESNLQLKKEWCKEHLPFISSFIGLNQTSKTFNKSVAKNGVIIDDRLDALLSSDNCLKILFRYNNELYEWQEGYKELLEKNSIDHVAFQWNTELRDILITYHHFIITRDNNY